MSPGLPTLRNSGGSYEMLPSEIRFLSGQNSGLRSIRKYEKCVVLVPQIATSKLGEVLNYANPALGRITDTKTRNSGLGIESSEG